MNNKLIKSKNVKDLLFSGFTAEYQLAHNLKPESYILILSKIKMIENNMKNLALTSLEGEKVSYNEIKDYLEKQIKEFFRVHDEICEEQFADKHKDKH